LAGIFLALAVAGKPVLAFEFVPRLAPGGDVSASSTRTSIFKKPVPSPSLDIPSCTMFKKDGCVVVTCNNGEKFNSCDWCKSQGTKEACIEKKDAQGCTYQLCKAPGKKAEKKNISCSKSSAGCKEIGEVEGCKKVLCPGNILPSYDCSALNDPENGSWVTYSVISGKCEYKYSTTEAGVKYCSKKCSAYGGVTLSKSDLIPCPQ
jgi:hypothetical protein